MITRHMFHLPSNSATRALCDKEPMAQGDLVRMTSTNVDCADCRAILADGDTIRTQIEEQMQAYLAAFNKGEQGQAHYHLVRAQALRGEMTERDRCCDPYPPAKHAADCPTVIHAPLPWAPANSALTACGVLGPIGNQLPVGPFPTCERCLPAHMRHDGNR